MILHRLPDSRFSEVWPLWRGETVVLLGGGPSLSQQQVALVQLAHEAGRVRCIAVNNAYQLAPFADVCYFADVAWFEVHRERLADFAGLKCSIQSKTGNASDDAVHVLRNAHHPLVGYGLSLNPQELVTGRNGGFQALNLAILAGAKTAILLGYDGKSADGKTHFHGGHPWATPDSVYEQYKESFRVAEEAIRAAGVLVVNASPGSAIDSFEKRPLSLCAL